MFSSLSLEPLCTFGGSSSTTFCPSSCFVPSTLTYGHGLISVTSFILPYYYIIPSYSSLLFVARVKAHVTGLSRYTVALRLIGCSRGVRKVPQGGDLHGAVSNKRRLWFTRRSKTRELCVQQASLVRGYTVTTG